MSVVVKCPHTKKICQRENCTRSHCVVQAELIVAKTASEVDLKNYSYKIVVEYYTELLFAMCRVSGKKISQKDIELCKNITIEKFNLQ